MVLKTYLFIISFFLLGALAFLVIHRQKTNREQRRSWIKYLTYFIIIHLVFFSIILHQLFFRTLIWIILVAGFLEIFNLFRGSGRCKRKVFVSSILIYLILSVSFFYFGRLSQGLILFTFLITAGFDAFSQIAGQLMGRHYLVPRISPGKTFEGLLGGSLVAVVAAFLLKDLVGKPAGEMALITAGIVLFAFSGDIFFSWYKRQYKVKDYSNVLPGHGGFLDRFDSLIAAGTFISLYSWFQFL